MAEYPDRVEIRPSGPLDGRLRPPGSKSVTNRALLAAALADGESRLSGALASDDTEAMCGALAALGVEVKRDGADWRVAGCGGQLRAPASALDARASGTTARFLTAAATLADGAVTIDGAPRMRERPIDDLVRALRELGAEIEILGERGCPPLRVAGGGLPGGRARIAADRSSQFVSAVLLAAPYALRDVELEASGAIVSRPYIDLTLQVMDAFGARARWSGERSLRVEAGALYRARAYAVEADASAATYPMAAAAITGGRVRIDGFDPASRQPDWKLADVLAEMGCEIARSAEVLEVRGPSGALRGIEVDMNDLPDAVLTLAVVALFASGPTTVRNVGNLRIKETDRLSALERELAKLGARVQTGPDWLTIEPGAPRPAEIETYDDHRMAMAFSLAGLRIPGVVIRDPACVAKTWPDYFAALERLTGHGGDR